MKLPKERPFKQYISKRIEISMDHDREIRLLQAALKDHGSNISYSEIIEKMIDEFLERLK